MIHEYEMEILPGKFSPTKQGSAEVVLFEDAFDGICHHRIELEALAPHPGCVLNLALNLPATSRVFTLNLCVEDQRCFDGWHKQDELLVKENHGKIGRLFRETDVEHKITQLWGDSLTFEFAPYTEAMDLVFIDGNRQYEYVMSDSENGRRMLRPGGLLVWHDYNYADSVTDAVDDFCRANRFSCKTVSQLTVAFSILEN